MCQYKIDLNHSALPREDARKVGKPIKARQTEDEPKPWGRTIEQRDGAEANNEIGFSQKSTKETDVTRGVIPVGSCAMAEFY